ncbi:MAG: L-serine ammonia-lyase, iron-sulfur-dependent subunit beta [Roseburia sp.]|nr:L-serine ammonia-lyase, iron-sulfur-dependent subunit beta [Roseburia sp.]MCM1096778.1 L-serine ammonia-lyase, iron-sulfur-dependent subunit beta [Ruminococcus flavefaciens]
MNSFDIIGPVMVGPSSSHTAGAVKIGNVARRLLGEPVKRAEIFFHGSFLSTGKGHGTDRALVAGLLGFGVADPRIPDSFRYADEAGMACRLSGIDLGDVHPNSVKLVLGGRHGSALQMTAASVGGGSILVTQINGLEVSFSGDSPTLIIHNQDRPGRVTEVTSLLGQSDINVAAMQLHRTQRGGSAVMVLECDQEVPAAVIDRLSLLEGILKVTYLGG